MTNVSTQSILAWVAAKSHNVLVATLPAAAPTVTPTLKTLPKNAYATLCSTIENSSFGEHTLESWAETHFILILTCLRVRLFSPPWSNLHMCYIGCCIRLARKSQHASSHIDPCGKHRFLEITRPNWVGTVRRFIPKHVRFVKWRPQSSRRKLVPDFSTISILNISTKVLTTNPG